MIHTDNTDLSEAIRAALLAGKRILDVYAGTFHVEYKADHSPVTEADRQAGALIHEVLANTGIPVLSEESEHAPYEERKNWKRLWIVDPLDGTKEFISRNGEFTVNIALCVEGKPVLGVIYAPVRKLLYYGEKGKGAYRVEGIESPEQAGHFHPVRLPDHKSEPGLVRIAVSRSHMNADTREYIGKDLRGQGEVRLITGGSSLKFCLLAEGSADLYPRFGATMEWDTAAGQAILESCGKGVYQVIGGEPLSYNRPVLRNPDFIAR